MVVKQAKHQGQGLRVLEMLLQVGLAMINVLTLLQWSPSMETQLPFTTRIGKLVQLLQVGNGDGKELSSTCMIIQIIKAKGLDILLYVEILMVMVKMNF